MHTLSLAFHSAWKVLLVATVLGAGVPALFAFGIRALALGNGTMTTGERPNPAGKVMAAVCFLAVVAAVALGLLIIISSGFGMKVSFEHVLPTLVEKK